MIGKEKTVYNILGEQNKIHENTDDKKEINGIFIQKALERFNNFIDTNKDYVKGSVREK